MPIQDVSSIYRVDTFPQLEFQDISMISRTFLTIFPGQFGMGIQFFALLLLEMKYPRGKGNQYEKRLFNGWIEHKNRQIRDKN